MKNKTLFLWVGIALVVFVAAATLGTCLYTIHEMADIQHNIVSPVPAPEVAIIIPEETPVPEATPDIIQQAEPTMAPPEEPLIKAVFDLTNQQRIYHGLNELSYASDLQHAADIRAKECSQLFSHTRPDGSSCHDIIEKDCIVSGENIILADKPIATAENMMAEWMRSPGHRANILLPDFTEMAVGVYEISNVVYVVQIFTGE